MRSMVLLAMSMCCLSNGISARDLSGTLNETPTVGTEVKRGFEMAFDCMMTNQADAQRISNCVSDAAAKDDQKHVDSEPFKTGLFYGASVRLSELLDTDVKLKDTNSVAAADLPYAKIEFKYAYEEFRLAQQKGGLSDAQIVEGTDMLPEGREGALRQLNNWAKSPPAEK